jgi:hypothetical protein
VNPLTQAEGFQHDIQQEPGQALSHALESVLGSRTSYRLQGENTGWPERGSLAERFYSERAKFQHQIDEHKPNGKYPNAYLYAQAKAQLDALYKAFPGKTP